MVVAAVADRWGQPQARQARAAAALAGQQRQSARMVAQISVVVQAVVGAALPSLDTLAEAASLLFSTTRGSACPSGQG
jgi:hypothetical protein